jgi:hypothetical protein
MINKSVIVSINVHVDAFKLYHVFVVNMLKNIKLQTSSLASEFCPSLRLLAEYDFETV